MARKGKQRSSDWNQMSFDIFGLPESVADAKVAAAKTGGMDDEPQVRVERAGLPAAGDATGVGSHGG
ncbi:hypothetical protein, partial [Pseudoclavibacter sp. AY1F1]|uniref:hypothetical protein n=1 Tax=Pseudoclavibacter sp. AY1F1 TaxID=2080583 RepID=UPI001CA550F8